MNTRDSKEEAKEGQVLTIVLNIHAQDPNYAKYDVLSAKQKIDDIAERIAVLCEVLAKTQPDAMWAFFWCEYGITSSDKREVSVQDAAYLQTKMLALTQKYAQLSIFAGTMSVEHEYSIVTEEGLFLASDHLAEVEQSYRIPEMEIMRDWEEKHNQQEIFSHHTAVTDLQKTIHDRSASLPSSISSLTNVCFVFQDNKVVAEIYKMTPFQETRGITGVVYHPKSSNHLVSLRHHITGETINVFVSICREAGFFLAKISEGIRGKAFLHCSIAACAMVTSNEMCENFLSVDNCHHPCLIKTNEHDSSEQLSVYQNNLLSGEVTLYGPLQNLYPFERKILDLFDMEIAKMQDAEAVATMLILKNVVANWIPNYLATAKNLYELLHVYLDALEKIQLQQPTIHFATQNKYGEHRLFDRPLPQLNTFAQHLADLVKTESTHNPEHRDLFPPQPVPIRKK